jgi:hypothetical protein
MVFFDNRRVRPPNRIRRLKLRRPLRALVQRLRALLDFSQGFPILGSLSGVPTLLPYPPYLKDHRVVGIGTGMGGHVLVIKPGKVDPMVHGKDFGNEAVEGADANPAIHGLSVKDHGVTHLMAKTAGPLLADHFGYDLVTSVFKFLAVLLFHCVISFHPNYYQKVL